MQKIRPQALYIGSDAIPSLIQFCQEQGHQRLLMIADQNTYAALGERVYQALQQQAFDCKLVLFDQPEVVADAHSRISPALLATVEADLSSRCPLRHLWMVSPLSARRPLYGALKRH